VQQLRENVTRRGEAGGPILVGLRAAAAVRTAEQLSEVLAMVVAPAGRRRLP
jgi:hypothetical protein